MILKTAQFPSYFEAMLSESRISASDARSNPKTRELNEGYFEELGITSLLDAGILIEGKLIGVVSAEHVGNARVWHIDEEAFVSTMASLTAQVFINNKKKQVEKELLIFKESLENSSDAIAMATPEGRHYYQNKAFNEIFGNIGDDPSIVYVDKNDAKSVFETIMRGERWEGEIKMYDKEKNIRDIFLRAYANKDDAGRITALVGIHTDVTARKQMYDALRESERMYATLIENLPGFAYRCKNDRDWTMEYISAGCLPITGYTPEDFINNNRISYNDIIHPDWHLKLWDIWQETLPKREPVQVEYPIICADGSQRWVAEIAAKIREVLG